MPPLASYCGAYHVRHGTTHIYKEYVTVADTMEDLATDGSVWERACDVLKEETMRLAEAGLHVIFDSVRDSQPGLWRSSRSLHPRLYPRLLHILLIDNSTSVVAVHRLNFRVSSSHAREISTKGDKLWLKDLFPACLPKSALVMLFAYNSSSAVIAAAIKLDDHAKNLLQWLSMKQKSSFPASEERYVPS